MLDNIESTEKDLQPKKNRGGGGGGKQRKNKE